MTAKPCLAQTRLAQTRLVKTRLVCFAFLIATIFTLSLASMPAFAKIPDGLLEDCPPENRVSCEQFWERQSSDGKAFLKSYPARDRSAALVCYALHGYGKITKELRECTRDLIGNRQSQKHCEKKGHELMSEAMEACRNAYRKKHNYPAPY